MTLLLVLVACEDKFEVTHRYSRPYALAKTYPIYLDTRDILVDIRVTPSIQFDEAFKIASNDKYIFVGEMKKGIHVYKRTDEAHATPLCFIECKYIKAFDVVDNLLYCNNFIDLLVIDVENPQQARILHRQWHYFNNIGYGIPFINNDGILFYEIAYKQVIMTGIETDTEPAPDFSEYDKLYNNFIIREIPDTLQLDQPYVGFANVEGYMYTLGWDNLMVCSYTSTDYGFPFTISPAPSYFNSYYYANMKPFDNLQYKDGHIFIHGFNGGLICLDYNEPNRQYNDMYNKVKDVAFVKHPENAFVFITPYQIRALFVDEYYNPTNSIGDNYSSNRTSLVSVHDENILTLRNQAITLYSIYLGAWGYTLQQGKIYSFGGASMLKEGNRLIVAGQQGLKFYDISNLENIVPIP